MDVAFTYLIKYCDTRRLSTFWEYKWHLRTIDDADIVACFGQGRHPWPMYPFSVLANLRLFACTKSERMRDPVVLEFRRVRSPFRPIRGVVPLREPVAHICSTIINLVITVAILPTFLPLYSTLTQHRFFAPVYLAVAFSTLDHRTPETR